MSPAAAATYYYAQGQRIVLAPDAAHVAILRAPPATAPKRRAAAAGADAGHVPGQALGHHVWLHDAADTLPAGQRLPVFRSGRTLLVALPEVRVEDEDPAALARVVQWLEHAAGRAEAVEERPGRMTLRAGPALAHDGVALARALVEQCGVASASPHLLRVGPKAAVKPGRA